MNKLKEQRSHFDFDFILILEWDSWPVQEHKASFVVFILLECVSADEYKVIIVVIVKEWKWVPAIAESCIHKSLFVCLLYKNERGIH